MPWEVKKNGSQYCVYKKGSSSPIKGGCHSTKDQATRHMRALYSNVEGIAASDDSQGIEVVIEASGLWRIKNVPLISTGIEYPLQGGGLTTFTEEQLADAVAAVEDPAVVAPRIKLGHSAGYNEALIGDAEMAFGRVDASTMYTGDNGQTIYGDMIVPEWLGKVMPIALPNRSMEGNFDVQTATGKNYEMVITAISLLGTRWPGCQVLQDLPLWYGGEIPEGVEFDVSNEQLAAQIAATGGGMGVRADADTTRIRRQFYDRATSRTLAGVPEGVDTYWWWIRAERIGSNGLYLIVEDEENGDLYKFGVSVNGDSVDFTEPAAVTIEYPEKTAAARAAIAAGMAIADPRVVVHASRADTGGPDKSTQEGASRMDDARRKALAAALGLPENATLVQIKAASEEQLRQGVEGGEPETAGLRGDEVTPEQQPPAHQTPPGTAPSGTGNTGTEEQEQREVERATRNQPEGGGDPNQPDAEAGKGDTVTIDRATFDRLNNGASAALAIQASQIAERQKGKVTAAIKAGKIPSARRGHYEQLMKADEEGTTTLLDSLTAAAVPLNELGRVGEGDNEGNEIAAGSGFPDPWFPEIAARRQGQDGQVARDQNYNNVVGV